MTENNDVLIKTVAMLLKRVEVLEKRKPLTISKSLEKQIKIWLNLWLLFLYLRLMPSFFEGALIPLLTWLSQFF